MREAFRQPRVTGVYGVGAMVGTKTVGVPSIRISAIATTTGLSVIKSNVVTFMIRLGKTVVTENASFVGLTGPADPDDIVFPKRMLTDLARKTGTCRLQGRQRRRAVRVRILQNHARESIRQRGPRYQGFFAFVVPFESFEGSEECVMTAHGSDQGYGRSVLFVGVPIRTIRIIQ
jgi:hypothetical protein